MTDGRIKLEDAAERFDVNRSTLLRWINAQQLVSEQRAIGKKWGHWVFPEDVKAIKERKSKKSKAPKDLYQNLVDQWVKEQDNGIHTGEYLSERAIEANLYGLKKFWQYLRGYSLQKKRRPYVLYNLFTDEIVSPDSNDKELNQYLKPCIEDITPENLKIALSNIKVDKDGQNCHFSMRDHMHKGVSSFYKLLIREGHRQEYEYVRLSKAKPKRRFDPKFTKLELDELIHLIKVSEQIINGASAFDALLNKTMVYFFAFAGLRRAELIRLKIKDINIEAGRIFVHGKGDKNRVVGIPPILAEQIEVWLLHRQNVPHDFLLHIASGNPLRPEIINHRMKALADRADLKITPHGLRHTFATILEASGTSWSTIQSLLGHSSPEVTKIYVNPEERAAVEWMKKFDFGIHKPQPMPIATKQVDDAAVAVALQILQSAQNKLNGKLGL